MSQRVYTSEKIIDSIPISLLGKTHHKLKVTLFEMKSMNAIETSQNYCHVTSKSKNNRKLS